MKYRIKVFPYKGKLRYMPQCKGWIFWRDILNPGSDGKYDNAVMNIIYSKQSCLEFIDKMKERDIRDQMDIEREIANKKFARENPITYIEDL